MLNIYIEYVRGILFVRLKGSLNSLTVSRIYDELIPMIKKYGIKNMVYNLDGLNSIDEFGNESLLRGYDEILNNRGNVLVVNNRFNLKYFKETESELTALKILQV